MKSYERVLSIQRYKANTKKYLWILVCILILNVILVTYNSKIKDIETDENINYYGTQAFINIETSKDTINSISTLAMSSDSYNSVNKQLQEKGYDIINANDYIVVGYYVNNCIAVFVYGQDDYNRLRVITDVLVGNVINIAKDKYKVQNTSIDSDTVVFNAVKQGTNNYSRINGDFVDHMNETNQDKSYIRNILSIDNLILTLGCIFIYLIIIFVISLIDKKLYTEDEIGCYTNIRCLGNLREKKYLEVTISAIKEFLNNYKIENIKVTSIKETLNDNDTIKMFLDKLSDNILAETEFGIIENASAIEQIGRYDGILLVILAGKDTYVNVNKAIKTIEIAGGKIIGYILV